MLQHLGDVVPVTQAPYGVPALDAAGGLRPRPPLVCSTIFTARRNARIASAVLATAIPSVRPSVTRRYCVKTTARSTVQFALSDSKMCLVL